MLAGIRPGQHHREARARLEEAGWRWLARGDWAQVYASPDGQRVARVVPFDPAWALHLRVCLANPELSCLPRIHWHCALAPAGLLVVMERLVPADTARATGLCCQLGETKCLGREPSDAERLAFADARLRSPELRRAFALLRATAAEGARRLAFFGGLDLRPDNVLQDETGRLVLVDPYFVAGLRLIPALLQDVYAVARHYSARELRGFLEIAAFEDEQDAPGPVLQELRERVAGLEAGGAEEGRA